MTTSPQELHAAWRAHLAAGLAEHIARAVDDQLPDGDEVIVAGTHLVLTRRRGAGSPRTVVTQEMTPVHGSDPLERTAERMLDDLQDMVIGTLHRVWPEDGSGAGMHPRARRDGDRITLGFASRSGEHDITLPPFPVPPEPDGVITAG